MKYHIPKKCFIEFLVFFRVKFFLLCIIVFYGSSLQAQQNYDIESKLLASDGGWSYYFGSSVSISGDIAIIGAPGDGDNQPTGAAYIFQFDGSDWVERQKLATGIDNDLFGISVSISGNIAVVGAYRDSTNIGAAYVYQFDGSSWVEQQKLTASDGSADDYFGRSVAVEGNTVFVGVPYANVQPSGNLGSVYVFQFDGSNWIEQQKLVPGDGHPFQSFGVSVGISGNTAIIGTSDGETGTIAAYTFYFDGSSWVEQQKLISSDGAGFDFFGKSVAISGDTAIVGAYGDDDKGSYSGSAYFFQFDGSSWIEKQKLTASDGAAYDFFGWSVAISGNTAIVGAPYDNDNGSYSGSAYVFHFDGGNWDENKITASYGAADDYFGRSVAINGKIAVAGVSNDEYNGYGAGSAAVYELVAQPNQVVASNGTYGNRAKISWNNRSGSVESFKIYRNGEEIASTFSSSRTYSDFDATPGKLYTYGVAAYNSTYGESPIVNALGWQGANGRLDGSVQTNQGAGVGNVEISVQPTATDLSTVLQFDGIDDYVDCGNDASLNFSGTDPFTIETWVQPAANNDTCAIVSKWNIPNGLQYLLSLYDGYVLFVRPTVSMSSGIQLQKDTWYHLAITSDDTDMRIYVDGVLRNSTTSVSANASPANLLIGARYNNDSIDYHFSGKIDEVRIWSIACDSLAIKTDMHRLLKGNESGLVAYWTFDDSSRSSPAMAGDYGVGGGNHGTIYGAQYQSDSSNVRLFTLTDPNGDFSVSKIYYGESRGFEIIPYKENHGFSPDFRNATLDINTPTISALHFTDTTSYTLSGKIQFDSTNCDVAGVEILLNGYPTQIVTSSTGEYSLSIEEAGVYTITPRYGDSVYAHTFEPADTAIFIDDDVFDLNFQDTRKNLLFGKVRGPCNAIIGVADLRITSYGNNAGCFDTTITTDASGNFRLFLPAQIYTIEMTDINPSNPFILQYFSPDTLDLTWQNRRRNFTYRTPPIIRVLDWPESGGGSYPVPIMTQGQPVDLIIEVLDVWGTDTCYVDEGTVIIYDGIGDQTSNPDTLILQNGMAIYSCVTGLPNILSGGAHPFQKLFQAVARVGQKTVSYEQWALVTGHRPREQTFVATTPEIPIMILRDPPGDQSYSFLAKDSSYSSVITNSYQPAGGLGLWADVRIGAITGIEIGGFFGGLSYDMGGYVIATVSVMAGTEHNITEGTVYTFTASEEFQTSDDDLVVGEDGDVYVGASFINRYALTDVIDFDWSTNQVVRDTSLAWQVDSLKSTFIYTETHIRNTLLPQLEDLLSLAISDSNDYLKRKYESSIDLWEQILFRNDSLKQVAQFEKNISFSAGTSYGYTSSTTNGTSNSYEYSIFFESQFAVGIGAVILGVPIEGGFQGFFSFRYVHSTETERLRTKTVGYSFGDDDPGDFFSVNVKTDTTYGTPVFDLVAGTSSCPWEDGTQPRDGVQIDLNSYVQNNVPPNDPATFILALGNTSQSGETREYYLSVIQASNLDGAIIRVGGVVIEDHLTYTIPAGEQLTATLTVERGPIAYDYENLQVRFYSPCDAEAIADTVTFSVHFISPCSEVTLLLPEDNWVINQANNDTLQFIITDYDVDNLYLENVLFQYRRYGENWVTAFVYPKNLLPTDYILEYWDLSALPDGDYELRAVSDCASNGLNYSATAAGVIDRQALLVFGAPQPSDGVLNIGENISISFSDEIDQASVSQQNISLITTDDSTALTIDIAAYQNTLMIVPRDTLSNYANRHLAGTVSGIRDIHGNMLRQPVNWSFRVSLNPVYWTVSNANQTVYQGVGHSFSRSLKNAGGEDESFTIIRYPAWLAPDLLSGTIPPGGEEIINFSIDTQLNIGSYQDTVFVLTSQGEEPLLVNLTVLHQPPAWSVSASSYSYSMNVTAQLAMEDGLSRDVFDILSVFVGEECRGTANVEYISAVNKYLVFLTVYSNQTAGENLSFCMWDASQGREFLFLSGNYQFQSNTVLGTVANPLLIEPDASIQSIDLNQGWTWMSLNLEAFNNSLPSLLDNLTPTDGDIIKGQTEFSQYLNGVGWQGSLSSLEIGQSYRIKLAAPDALRISGLPVEIATTTVPVDTGWNWIGYLQQEILGVNEALSTLPAVDGDLIKNQTEFAQYVPASDSWEGSLKKMVPGEGYLLKSHSGGNLVYPALAKMQAGSYFLSQKPDWAVDVRAYEYNMTITGVLEYGDEEVQDSSLIIGAFAGDTCRGVAQLKYLPSLDRYFAFLSVYAGSAEGDSLHFRVYYPEEEKTRQVEELLVFQNDQVAGDLESPFAFTVIPIGDELVPYDFYLRQNYPNPFNPITTIEYGLPKDEKVKVTVYNMLGQKVKTLVDRQQKAGRYSVQFDVRQNPVASGIYFYRIKAGNFHKTRKMLLVK